MEYSQEIDALLNAVAAEGGEMDGLGLADFEVVKEAEAFGLIKITMGDAWGLGDRISLTPRQRMAMGLPPIVHKPSALILAMHTVAATVSKLFGQKSHLS